MTQNPKMKFARKDLARIVAHAKASKEWRKVYDEGGDAPGLILVHDDGVYLMSNGHPYDIEKRVGRKGEEPREMGFCAYAEGTDPALLDFEDWWEFSRELVGGDDFAIPVPIEWAEDFLSTKSRTFAIAFEGEDGMRYFPPRRKK